MVTFTAFDWFWVVGYIVLMVTCGILFYRLASRGESDFFLAGRGLPWWLPASSVYATHTATDTPIWVGGVIYLHGLRGLWYSFFCAWCAISAFVSTRIFRRSLAYTQAEWQSLRFSGMGAELLRGWLAGWQVSREQGLSSTEASHVLNLPRSTLYRWQKRLKKEGPRGLEERSRRPKRRRQPTWSPELAQRILALREQYPRWGKSLP